MARKLRAVRAERGAVVRIRGLEVFASPALGRSAMPVSTNPPVIVFGRRCSTRGRAARFFLLMRS